MATVEILCRYDAAKQAPVVFLRDTIQGDKIQVWDGERQSLMPMDYYSVTRPLSAEDERVLAERFKKATNRQDQVVHINHRMPRVSKALPNLLASSAPAQNIKDINPPPAARQDAKAAGRGKPIEQQPAPSAPVGDLPQANETPAPLPKAQDAAPVAQVATAPTGNEPASVALFNKIKELNARMSELAQKITGLNTELANATTDYDTAKQAVEELKPELMKAIEAEAAEELNRRKQMLAALTDDPALATAAQALHDAGTAQNDTETPATASKTQAQATPAKATTQPRQGGKFASKSAPAKTVSKPAAKSANAKK